VRAADAVTGSWQVSLTVAGPTDPPPAPASSRAQAQPAPQLAGQPFPFAASIQSFLSSRSGRASVAAFDANSGITYSLAPQNSYITASIVKVDILATLLRRAQDAGRGLTSSEQATATQMIEFSDNNAATALWNEVGGAGGVAQFNSLVGMPNTVPGSGGLWGLTRTTVEDQVQLMRVVAYPNGVLGSSQRAYLQGLMRNVTPSQRWGVSGGVPGGTVIELKNGWLPVTGGWEINSIGHIAGSGRDYVIAVLTSSDPSMGYGISTIEGVSARVWSGLSMPAPTRLAVGLNRSGTLVAFAATATGRVLAAQQAGPGGGFGGWVDMGLPATAAGAPVVATNRNGVLQVFVHTTDNRLQTSWQQSPGAAFGGWADLGLDGGIAATPAVGTNSNGTLQLFAQGPNGQVFSTWQSGPNQGFVGWIDMHLPALADGTPAVGANANRVLQLFFHTADNRLQTMWQTGPSQGWSGWADMGLDGALSGDPALATNSIGTLQVFENAGGRIVSTWQRAPNQGFGGWIDMNMPAQAAGTPATGVNASGALQLFVHTVDNRLQTSWQAGPSQAWPGWADMGFDGQITSGATAATNTNGTMVTFVRGPAFSAYDATQTGPNQGFAPWTNLNLPA
ncbi:MAG: class A beta-lactamase-related serine hydrolase, partial [Actinomycetota bacterium]|nr:class A beta-lactamase-related serine hydrolase [Actinomycetota bacterium]